MVTKGGGRLFRTIGEVHHHTVIIIQSIASARIASCKCTRLTWRLGLSTTSTAPHPGGGQFPIVIGTNSYQNTYFIFFSLYSYMYFHCFHPYFAICRIHPQNTTEYTVFSRIHENTHRIHTEYRTCKNTEKCCSRNTRAKQPTTSEIPEQNTYSERIRIF